MDTSTDTTLDWARSIADFARKQNDNECAQCIEHLFDEYSQRLLNIVVLGLEKRGKSTFCNGYLGRQDDTLAPVDWKPATNAICSYHPTGEGTRAVVTYEGDEVVEEEIPCEEIRKFVTEGLNCANARGVAKMDVYGDFSLLPPKSVLHDLPGADSFYAYHTQIVYKKWQVERIG